MSAPCRNGRDAAGDMLASGRAAIEQIDRAILRLVAERLQVGEAIARSKHAAGLPVLDPAQEARVVRRAAELAREAALPEEGVRELFWRIITLTRRAEDHAA
ncbi:MAG TPA: chorismate mutase [Gemmatimonadaceae bacterium]|nr:chorismate mutase [Gemmatimonadaceae bacterium]